MDSSAVINAPVVQFKDSVERDDLDQTLREFNLMLRYVLAEGLQFDETTRHLVASVQGSLIDSKGTLKTGGSNEPGTIDIGVLMSAHAALSKIIAPATPLSLQETESAPGLYGSLSRPPLIKWMIFLALISAVGFVVSGIVFGASNTSSIAEKLNWCFAASLGAAFYVLFTALNYVKDRTFDPRYNSVYIIRFVLGVLAGLILAIVLGTSLSSSSTTSTATKILVPAVVALLGGFSTEAVYQILQRLVDMLLAAIRGDDSNAAKAKASETARKELLNLADDPGMPSEMKSKVLAAAKRV
jgi:hypothetical protein